MNYSPFTLPILPGKKLSHRGLSNWPKANLHGMKIKPRQYDSSVCTFSHYKANTCILDLLHYFPMANVNTIKE